MQKTQGKRRRLLPMEKHKRNARENAQSLDEQRAIAGVIAQSPKEMIAASNAFLCGWLARDSVENKSA